MEETDIKLYLYPSFKIISERRAAMHKAVSKYIIETRSDVLCNIYHKKGCIKVDTKGYMEK